MSVFPLLYEIHGIPYIESCVEDLGSLLLIILYWLCLILGGGGL